jgi:hypothetical protein
MRNSVAHLQLAAPSQLAAEMLLDRLPFGRSCLVRQKGARRTDRSLRNGAA